jgi:NADPH-dependent curcumin reductase CurA
MTAYFGLLDVGQPKPGETIVVSAASGAVGQVVGQIGKIMGCRVVGIAGGAKKCAFVKDELGFDACVDYKGVDYKAGNDLDAALRAVCPKGIDVYFDNVGGEVSDAVLRNINFFGRVALCGRWARACSAPLSASGCVRRASSSPTSPASTSRRSGRWASGSRLANSSTAKTS